MPPPSEPDDGKLLRRAAVPIEAALLNANLLGAAVDDPSS
jgi:hypothetical protein